MEEFNVKKGDIYVFRSNTGSIWREIALVGNKMIGYICEGKERACKISTFKRWWKGATLEYRIPDED